MLAHKNTSMSSSGGGGGGSSSGSSSSRDTSSFSSSKADFEDDSRASVLPPAPSHETVHRTLKPHPRTE